MDSNLQARFDSLEKRRIALTDRVLALTPEQQQAHPIAKAFNPAEVLEHFAKAEAFNLTFLEKTPPNSLVGKKASPGFGFKFAVDGLKKADNTMQTLPAMTPDGLVDANTAAKHWESERAKAKGYLEQVTDPDAPFAKMHFLFGTLSANQFLQLMEAHIQYHEIRFPKV